MLIILFFANSSISPPLGRRTLATIGTQEPSSFCPQPSSFINGENGSQKYENI